jgi:hypothetical protein
MASWQLTAYRESGLVSVCPIRFTDFEAAKLSAELAMLHFGSDFTIMIEENDDGAEQKLRSADQLAAGDAAANGSPG